MIFELSDIRRIEKRLETLRDVSADSEYLERLELLAEEGFRRFSSGIFEDPAGQDFFCAGNQVTNKYRDRYQGLTCPRGRGHGTQNTVQAIIKTAW